MNITHQYKRRFLEDKLRKLFNNFPVIVVSGARQVGKSTLLERVFSDVPRVVFDPVVDIENARSEPDLFLRNRKSPLILDEIQYAPELVPAIKRLLEKDKMSGQYLITGSQQWGVMKLLAESLAGRAVFLDLEGFSVLEIAEVDTQKNWLKCWIEDPDSINQERICRIKTPFTLYEQLWRGFLPEVQFLERQMIADYLFSYQRTYIERDVRMMAEISDFTLFSRFFRLCSALTAQEINRSQLGRELGVTPQTADRWLDILVATFQWVEISPYSGNTIKRISGKSKGYIADTGIACHTQAISQPEVIGAHPMWGAIFETAVINEIRKQSSLLPVRPNFYHWRVYSGAEVDLLLEWNGAIYPIEVKAKANPAGTDAKGIVAFREAYPKLKVKKGLIVAPAETFYPVSKDVYVMPWDAIIR